MAKRAVQDGASITTTYYVGQHYEVQVAGGNQTVTKYYYAGGKRVAFRRANVGSEGALYYVHSDNLGSANKITDSSGVVKNAYLYYPWGSARERSEQIAYDYRYNGQRAVDSAGMYYYSDGGSYGRFYDPVLARWTQADSVMPKPEDPQTWANSQNWNRYSYASNNPLTRTDPSGHCDPGDVSCLAGLLLESFSHPELRDGSALESGKTPQQAFLELPGVEGLLQRLGLSAEQIAAIKANPSLAAAFETLPMVGMEGAPALGKAKMLKPGTGWLNPDTAWQKWEKHADDLGFKSLDEYLEGARNLMQEGQKGVVAVFRPWDGATVFIDMRNGAFGVLASDGKTIENFYKLKDAPQQYLKKLMDNIRKYNEKK